jgi:hypothetical protein
MREATRLVVGLEAITFIAAALVHSGLLTDGYEHQKAAIAESVIAVVLVLGFAFSWILPARIPAIGMATQGFALLGTLVGVVAIAAGVGPRTVPDIVYHIGIVVVLMVGLGVAMQARSPI